MDVTFAALCVLVFASQLLCACGTLLPLFPSAINVIKGAGNAATLCNNYTTTCASLTDMNGKYFVQLISPGDSPPGTKCEFEVWETLGGDNAALKTNYAIDPEGPQQMHFLAVALKNGQFRNILLPNILEFGTVNVIYFNCKIGYVLLVCRWNENSDSVYITVIATTTPHPSAADVQVLKDAAAKQGISTADLTSVDHTDCPCQPNEDFVLKVVNIAFQTLAYLLIQQVSG